MGNFYKKINEKENILIFNKKKFVILINYTKLSIDSLKRICYYSKVH